MAPTEPSALAAILVRSGRSPLAILAALGALVAASFHAYVTPIHFAASPGQGLFMLGLAIVQVSWAAAFLWRPRVGTFVAGLAIALASIAVWLLAVTLRPPFAREAEAVDAIATLTKLAEAATLVALVLIPVLHSRAAQVLVTRSLPVVAIALVLGVAGGGGAYAAGLLGERVFPAWIAEEGHSHGGVEADDGHAHEGDMAEGAHEHGAEPVVVQLDARGAQRPGSFALAENGTRLALQITIETAGQGAWFYTGEGGAGDLVVQLVPPEGDALEVVLAGTAGQAGVAPVASASQRFGAEYDAPVAGEWSVVVLGQGANAKVTVTATLVVP